MEIPQLAFQPREGTMQFREDHILTTSWWFSVHGAMTISNQLGRRTPYHHQANIIYQWISPHVWWWELAYKRWWNPHQNNSISRSRYKIDHCAGYDILHDRARLSSFIKHIQILTVISGWYLQLKVPPWFIYIYSHPEVDRILNMFNPDFQKHNKIIGICQFTFGHF